MKQINTKADLAINGASPAFKQALPEVIAGDTGSKIK